MKRKILALALLAGSGTAQTQDRLSLRPDPGASPVGTAQNLSYAQNSIRVVRQATGIRITQPANQVGAWSLTLRPPAGVTLAAGCYERARRFAEAARPEIDFSFGSSGCNSAFGRFRILELETDSGGDVIKLAVDFNQQCERYGRAVAGQLRFNSSVPVSDDYPRAVIEPSGTFSFVAAPTAVGSSAPGGNASFSLTRATAGALGNPSNGASLFYSGPLPGGSTGSWSLDLAAPGNVPLAIANYPVATRYPFQAATNAGLDFSYHGSGCSSLQGSFNVTAVQFDGMDQVPLVLNATFNQRCPNASGPLTQGSVVYAANLIGPSSAQPSDQLGRSGFESGEAPVSASPFYSPTCN